MQTARVALGGFMGVGKSTVGRLLADRLGVPFVDMDQELALRHGPIAEQFARDGEAAFRARERALLLELCDGRDRVIATGGGVWADADNRDALREHYRLVVLDAPLQVLAERVGSGPGRPNWARAVELYAARREAYADAERIVDASQPPDTVVAEVLEWLS